MSTQPAPDAAQQAEYAKQWAEYYKQQAAAAAASGAPPPTVASTTPAAENGSAPGDVKPEEKAEDEKLWEKVQENPQEFDTWVKLIKQVEALDDLTKVRRSLLGLLKEYPLCFGYWKRLAGHEKRHKNLQEAEEILEKGVAATPRSHQLWTYYCQEMRATKDQEETRRLFERAAGVIGRDWSSHTFWNLYLAFEMACGKGAESSPNFEKLLCVYLRILSYPTAQLDEYFEKFKALAMSRPQQELKSALDTFNNVQPEPCGEEDDNVIPDRAELIKQASAMYNKSAALKTEIAAFESAVNRPYFHIKALDAKEITNWKGYLAWATKRKAPVERKEGQLLSKTEGWAMPVEFEQVQALFERCLVACANYPEMWLLYIRFLEDYDLELARKVYTQATTIYLKNKMEMQLSFASFEERHGNVDAARERFLQARKREPHSLEIVIGHANFERRQCTDDTTSVCKVYESALETFEALGDKGMKNYAFTAMHFARFLVKSGDVAKAREAHNKALDVVGGSSTEPSQFSAVLVLATASLEAAQTGDDVESKVCAVYEGAIGANPKLKLPVASKAAVWEHYIAYLEDNGKNIRDVERLKARYLAQTDLRKSNPKKRKAATETAAATKQARTETPTPNPSYGAPPAAAAAAAYAQYPQYNQQYPQYDPNAAAAAAQYQQYQQYYGQQYGQ